MDSILPSCDQYSLRMCELGRCQARVLTFHDVSQWLYIYEYMNIVKVNKLRMESCSLRLSALQLVSVKYAAAFMLSSGICGFCGSFVCSFTISGDV